MILQITENNLINGYNEVGPFLGILLITGFTLYVLYLIWKHNRKEKFHMPMIQKQVILEAGGWTCWFSYNGNLEEEHNYFSTESVAQDYLDMRINLFIQKL